MSIWTTKAPWEPDDDFRFPGEIPRVRAKSFVGRTLLRNSGPRPIETEDDRIAKSQAEMARLVREAQQMMFMDRLMKEVDAEERVTGEPPVQPTPIEAYMDSDQVSSEPPMFVNGLWNYHDISSADRNGGMDL